jgi:uncharacterized protein YbgA (DUF1722 family)
MRLTGDPALPRLVTRHTGRDLTDLMTSWALKRVRELESEDLCGFIFKSKSPSSGMERVKVYNEEGMPSNNGTGIFAGIFMGHFRLIPVEEEGRLHDPKLRENFIERVFALKRWRRIAGMKASLGALVSFHSREKLLILSHSERHLRKMGKIVAEGKKSRIKDLYNAYEAHLMEALKLKTTIKKQINVLHHMLGYFKKELDAGEKEELLGIIEQYRNEHIPLIVPVTLIRHYIRKYDKGYLADQAYLNPHPLELRLRNHA